MNLQNPKKFKMLIDQAHEAALNVLCPISRKYDKAEHAYPKELDMLSSLVDGMNAGAAVNKRGDTDRANKNGVNMSTTLSIVEMCYGDTGLLLSMLRQGLGNSAIAAMANDESWNAQGHMGSNGHHRTRLRLRFSSHPHDRSQRRR